MKKFTFSLDGLLKLREFKETQVKTELGVIVTMIEETKQLIIKTEGDLLYYSEQQQEMIEEATLARDIQQVLKYVKASEAKKEKLKNDLIEHYKKFEQKKIELAAAMADAKLIANLKDKKKLEHKKEYEKKQQQDIEELFNMRKKA